MLLNRFVAGMKVDYVPTASDGLRSALSQVSNQGIAKSTLTLGSIGGSAAQSAFQKAKETAKGARRRGVVDRVVDENCIRVMLCDDGEIVWATSAELEPLDAVSELADVLTTKTLKQQLTELEAEEKNDVRAPRAEG